MVTCHIVGMVALDITAVEKPKPTKHYGSEKPKPPERRVLLQCERGAGNSEHTIVAVMSSCRTGRDTELRASSYQGEVVTVNVLHQRRSSVA